MTTGARARETVAAAAAYAGFTVLFTWPLARGLSHTVAGDFGDPILNSWILAWDATHMFSTREGWWNANIYYPHPLALAYSEHLAAQAIQILPIYLITSNPILCYNLLLLSSFVLSGVGVFLLARELTGNWAAAFVAGMAYAFAPYRISALPHLQVLSSAWMPFALYGFRRYFDSRRAAPLAWGALAWLAQNLSCGYYLLFFAPIMAMYLIWELTARGLWREVRVVAAIAAAVAVVGAATLPFVLPYLNLRALDFDPRSIVETQSFSADVYGYFTADSNLRLWGSIWRAWPKAEGYLFPGVTILALAAVAVRLRSAIAIASLAVIFWLLLGFTIREPGIKITSLSRTLTTLAVVSTAILTFSRSARTRLTEWLRSPEGFFAIATLFAVVMSFGPQIHAQGRVVLETNIYVWFYRFVPGFDGLRVPARFAMIVALGLAMLCALGLKALRSFALAAIFGIAIFAESFAAPIATNQNSGGYVRPNLAPLPPLERTPPPVYQFVAGLRSDATLVELPLGEPAFDVRYMFFSTVHWRRLVNGYSGGRPAPYDLLDSALQDVFTRPERAWNVLRTSSYPTHAIVHEQYYAGDRGAQVSRWLLGNGAREIASFAGDHVFELPQRTR